MACIPIQSNINADTTFWPAPAGVGIGDPDPNLVVSTLTVGQYVSTPQAFVSSINGAAYPSPIAENQVVSTLFAANYVSTPQLFISSINSVVYPPPAQADIVVSSITANEAATAANLFCSSINGANYPPIAENPNQSVSTLYATSTLSANQIITALITGISTIEALTITNINNLTCSSINGVNTNLLVPPRNTAIGTTVMGPGNTATLVLPNLFAGAPDFAAFAGYIVPSPTKNIIPEIDFDTSGAPISSITISAATGDTVNYIAVGQIIG